MISPIFRQKRANGWRILSVEIVLSASFLACVEECISERESRFEEGRVDIFAIACLRGPPGPEGTYDDKYINRQRQSVDSTRGSLRSQIWIPKNLPADSYYLPTPHFRTLY